MEFTHRGRVHSALRFGWVAVIIALAAATLPTAAAWAAPVEAQHVAPELGPVTVGENIPVAPVEPLTEDNAPGRVSGGIGVDPDDPDHIVTFTWDMHAAPGETCQYHTSFDGGATWTTGTFPVPPGFNTESPGNLGFCSNERGGNRSSTHGEMEFGSGDTVYTSFVAIKEGRLGNSLLVARSNDGGQTFETPVEVIEGGTNATFTAPHLFWGRVAVDPGAGVGGADRVYAQGRGSILNASGDLLDSNVAVAVSDDGGQTWAHPIAVNRVGEPSTNHPDFGGFLGSQIVIAPDGGAFTAWRTLTRPEGEIRIGRTTDGGQTWTVDKVVDVRAHTTADGTDQFTSGYPRLAIDDTSGALYLVYHQDPPLPGAAPAGIVGPADHWFDPHAAVYLVKSTDDGATWSDPIKVNDEPHPEDGNVYHETRIPNVAVSPTGRVDVVWMDRRHWTEGRGSVEEGSEERPSWRFDDHCVDSHAACTEARISDIYYAFSTDGGATFSTDVRVTDYSSNDDTGWEWNIGPFWHHGMDLDHAGDDLVAAWGDSRRAQALPTVGWTNTASDTVCPPDCRVASGVGGPENHDLFIAEVSHGTDPAASRRLRSVPAENPADLSAALSQIGYPGGEQGRLTGNRITSPFAHAVVVNEGDWASALVGSVLARRYMGPVLATPATALPPSVSDEIDRMDLGTDPQADPANPDIGDPTQAPCSFAAGVCINEELVHRALGGAFILGDTGAVSAGIQTDLDGRGIDVTRFEQTPAQMAAAVALHLDDRFTHEKDPTSADFVPAFDAVVVVNPNDPDSAGVSALAANRRLPVLFVNSDSIPPATTAALDALDIENTVAVGDTDAINDTVLAALPGAERLSGADAFATSAAIVDESHNRGLPTNVVYAVGGDPMHAALAGSPVARAGGLLVQVPDAHPDTAMDTVGAAGLAEHVDKIVRFGGDFLEPVWPDTAFLSTSNITSTSVILSWTAATDDTGIAGYRVLQDGVEIADQTGTTLEVTGLTPETSYDFEVVAYDAAGKEAVGPSQTVLTLAPADTTAPSWPAGAVLDAADVSATGVMLSWPAAADDSAVAGYRVYQDPGSAATAQTHDPGTLIADQAGTSLQVSGLSPDTAYAFTVEAYDAAGNESHDGPSTTVTTLPDGVAGGACPAGEVPATPFTDIGGNSHEANIACIFWYGVTQGTSATTYSPANRVRRDQMASFIARLMESSGVSLPAASDQGFVDIGGNVHADRINQLAEVGVVLGTSATTYAPGQEVRRDQMASFLVRAYEVIDGAQLARDDSPFTDVAGNVHLANIEKAATAGFTLGTTPTTYAPRLQVRRDQMGSFLARVLDRGFDDGHVSLPSD